MKYKKFRFSAYKAIIDSEIAVIETPVPIIGVNESGKSSALEGIANFDFRNDDLIKSKGWKFINRYKPQDVIFSVTCDIELTQAELDAIKQPLLLPQPEPEPEPKLVAPPTATSDTVPAVDAATGLPIIPTPAVAETVVEPKPAPSPVVDELADITVSGDTLGITRTFEAANNSKSYSINGASSDRIQTLAQEIVNNLPRAYYFDNFLENQMPDSIPFSKEYIAGTDDTLNEYQSIIEGAFSDAGINLREFLKNSDSDAQATLIATVNNNVTKKIIDDWRKMHLPEGEVDLNKFNNVTIELKLGEKKNTIDIKVIEQFPGTNGMPNSHVTMKISERSLGFKWFFNFSARKCFAAVHEEKFLYLIDEPGSYLHNSAQTVLLNALIDLATKHPVIYSTHSEFLLDPEKININRIKIVQKEDHAIKLIPLSNASVKKHEGALSTLYNALRMRTPLETVLNKKVIVTEGITDFYFWKPIVDVAYLPGSGAGNNKYLLSIAIGASKKYLALFDGDEAGNRAIVQYKGYFGEAEARNWRQYSKSDATPSVLEKLLSISDLQRLKTISGQQDTKQAITLLFFNDKVTEFWSGIDAETRGNVQRNVDVMVTSLGLTAANLNHGFVINSSQPITPPSPPGN